MAGKLRFLLGFGAGYVLGARAGRERYEQIITKVQSVRDNPTVRAKAAEVRDVAAEQASQAQTLVKEKADEVVDAATAKFQSGHTDAGDRTDTRPTAGDEAEVPPTGPAGEHEVTGLVTAPVAPPDAPR